ncbi:pilus assembly protein FimV [Sinobacterium caligoides]|uniref:Pilus assembly protein FimV n=1 Tax=Sinobacterium caligoides TaxID=933926 RepID=A0A3N2DJK1_9GAMM|nr:FimV/HubP family polar landmark protein [Sinobacterium caligoides]ROR99969.1 pilus assembly protein FimV [Sinobacterium caligoides]
MVRKLAGALLTLSVLDAKVAYSLGLGELQLNSSLNQPLEAQIQLLNVGELDSSQIHINLANENDFNRAGVERVFFLTDLRFRVEVDGRGGGTLFISSHKLVREPFVNFLIETRWPTGRLLREYTVLIDLPVYSDTQSVTQIKPAEQALSKTATQSSETVIQRAQSQVKLAKSTPSDLSSKPTPVAVTQAVAAVQGDFGPTVEHDTLWAIAQRARPSSDVTIQQTMLAIQQANPDAFLNGNINRLKTGQVLKIPSIADIKRRSREQAVREVEAQNNQRETSVNDRVIEAANVDSELDHVARQKETAQLRLTTPSAGGDGVLAEGDSDAGAAVLAAQENLSKLERENGELKSRLQDMDGQIDDLQKIIELQNSRLERLQAQAAKANEATAESVESDPEVLEGPGVEVDQANNAVDIESGAAESDQENQINEAALDALPASGEGPSSEVAVVAESTAKPDVVEKPTEHVLSTRVVESDDSFVDEFTSNPLYWGAAGGILLLLIVGLVARRRRNEDEDDFDEGSELIAADTEDHDPVDIGTEVEQTEAAVEDSDLSESSLADSEVAESSVVDEIENYTQDDLALQADDESLLLDEQAGDTPEPQVVDEVVSETEVARSEDVVGEADVYIAYGRFDKAVEILDAGLASQPNDEALHLKKMEVLAQANERQSFVNHYSVMSGVLGAAALHQAKDMLSGVPDGADWLAEIASGDAGDLSDVNEEVSSIADTEITLDLDEASDDEILQPVESLVDEEFALDLDLDVDLDEKPAVDVIDELDQGDSAREALDELSLDELSLDDFDIDTLSDDELSLSADQLEDEITTSLSAAETARVNNTEVQLDSSGGGEDNASSAVELEGIDELDIDLSDDDFALMAGFDDSELTNLDDSDLSDLDELTLDDDLNESVVQGAPTVNELELSEVVEQAQSNSDFEVSDELDLAGSELDLGDFDLDDAELGGLDLAGSDLDLGELDIEGLEDVASSAGSSSGVELSIDDLDLDDDLMVMPEGDDLLEGEDADDEVATKLDLARAYIDMGDDDGARDILDEVVLEGDDTQRQQADELIASIS